MNNQKKSTGTYRAFPYSLISFTINAFKHKYQEFEKTLRDNVLDPI